MIPNRAKHHKLFVQKTKKSGGVHQYNPKQPHKWAFKYFVRTRQSRITYDFFLYGGKNSVGGNPCSAFAIVLKLSEGIPQNLGFTVF